jgi:protein tyrosine phosphatase (PTP) superfamily phosphohydrolase (DUF442 family)
MIRLLSITLFTTWCLVGCADSSSVHSTEAEELLPALREVQPGIGIHVGGEPAGVPGLRALQELGVRSIIDVDATPPGNGAEELFSMRVIHLPLKYSGITIDEARIISGLLETLERPIYVHCHHGTNRAPAAVAIGLVGTGEWTSQDGLALLHASGTDSAFKGLIDSVGSAVLIAPALRQHHPGRVDPGDLAITMDLVESEWTRLEKSAQTQWTDPGAPATAAQLVDLLRCASETSGQHGRDFIELAESAIDAAQDLEDMLLAGRHATATDQLLLLEQSCSACHRRYRD